LRSIDPFIHWLTDSFIGHVITQASILQGRTKQFAIRIVKLFRSLPKTEEARVIGRQVLRSGTSVAANYRAVCRSRSKAEFIAKVGVVVEEADETVFWLELLGETGIVQHKETPTQKQFMLDRAQ
jgi:four helix bundle protein